jgi:pre-mRNA cleavage complex 2 protein Pcf11
MRNTWAGIFPATKLYSLDARVQMLDPAWPIAPMPTSSTKTSKASSSIHVNPKFLQVIIPDPPICGPKLIQVDDFF